MERNVARDEIIPVLYSYSIIKLINLLSIYVYADIKVAACKINSLLLFQSIRDPAGFIIPQISIIRLRDQASNSHY